MHTFAIAALHFFQFLATILTLVSSQAIPGCTPTCNNITIHYPFGIGDERCYHNEGFKLVCSMDQDPPILYMNNPGYRVVKIKLVPRVVYLDTGFNQLLGDQNWPLKVLDDRFYRISAAQNVFVALGCGFKFSVSLPRAGGNASTCDSSCHPGYPNMTTDGTCSGNGCCCITVAEDSNSYVTKLDPLDEANSTLSAPRAMLNATFIVEKGEYWRRTEYAIPLQKHAATPESAPQMPTDTVVNWMLGNSSCAEAQKSGDFGCLSNNSDCHDDPPRGYGCQCQQGYIGNPYMPNGCQDIDECTQPDPPPCFGQCINTVGSYDCICPSGTDGNPRVKDGCAPSKLKISGLVIAIGVGSGILILLFVLAAVVIRRKVRAQNAKRKKEYFFKQNRGLLLQQLVDKDIAERMIFSLEELEKATHSFDESRKLGGGGHGTVYKGILSDQRVVAIKKSKYAIKREIDDFINEVVILSQVNHRNVVKLFGCCLETEVPLLVYEFISNGTLHDHLHVCAPQSLSWKERIRIALEIARSLAYLHSAASVSIIHRDIKTTNILLDDRLIAKISDFGASRGMPIDQIAVTTTIQGTFGYLDPEYYRTSRLTEKSDVYSFGVILVELLTRRRPSSYISPEGFNLVSQFVLLVNGDRLCDIVDPRVTEEAKEEEANEVSAIAVMCLNPNGKDRPTMRQVETRLEALQSSAVHLSHPSVEESNDNNSVCNLSRLYSMEDEFWSSMSFPR
ncbi:unnamed protein product [Urochloa decumbens]|uniref:Uncharacterized protein n=1 Tax=Urochloa decumbens TaxID=240449 RepID=A0ABC9BFT3_9POAL